MFKPQINHDEQDEENHNTKNLKKWNKCKMQKEIHDFWYLLCLCSSPTKKELESNICFV